MKESLMINGNSVTYEYVPAEVLRLPTFLFLQLAFIFFY